MAGRSTYLVNKLVDWFFRGQALTPPPTLYFGLLVSTKGPRANSTAYALNDTISLTANDGKTHLYKCSTAGTSAAAQSTLYPGAANEVITDGTAAFTEQDANLDAGTAAVEPSGGAYARVGVTGSLTAFSGTQGAGTTTASTGTGASGTISNNAAITFPAPTANWGFVWGVALYDAASAGNLLETAPLATVKTVNSGDAAPSIAAGAFSHTDN